MTVPGIDIRTANLMVGTICILLAVAMTYMSLTRKTYPGFHQWTFGFVCGSLGMSLVGMRGFLPDLLTVVVANLLVILFFFFLARGLVDFSGAEHRNWLDVAPLLIVVCAFIYLTYYESNVAARIVIVSIVASFFSLRCATLTQKQVASVLGRSCWMLALVFYAGSALYLLRSLLTILYETRLHDFMAGGMLQGLSMLLSGSFSVVVAIGLILISAQRVENELTAALGEIKALQGLIPICANCKKIRDDAGYWNEIESYIKAHSEAEFSHSICPECAKKLYPEYYKG